MDSRIQILAIIAAAALLFVVLELVRRRRLQERYALLWLVCTVFLLILAAWREALTKVANLVGIAYPPNALFFLAFAAILVVLLHFSVVISRLSDQTKILAQRVAGLDERIRRHEDATVEDSDEDAVAAPVGGSRFSPP
ncbi:MAG TPA: DUF2304 domain-containing protein [Solirubrobacteraceae bacterium]